MKRAVFSEIAKQRGKLATTNDEMKIDVISKKLIRIFDTNKNGRLEYQEAISAFCVFCKGSIQNKIKYQMLAYSEVLNGAEDHSTKPADLGIRMKNLKKFMLCVLKLALESKSEIMLDYPIDKLAAATAERCFEFAGIADKSKGICSLE